MYRRYQLLKIKGVQHVYAVYTILSGENFHVKINIENNGTSHCQIVYYDCFLTVMSFILVLKILILLYSVSNCLIALKLRGVFKWAIRLLYINFQDILKNLKNIYILLI